MHQDDARVILLENDGDYLPSGKTLFLGVPKCGLSHIASVLLNSYNEDDMGVFQFLSCT